MSSASFCQHSSFGGLVRSISWGQDGKQTLTHVDSKERVLHILVFNHTAYEPRAGKLEDAGTSQRRSAPPPRRSCRNLLCESAASIRDARRFLQERFKRYTDSDEAGYSNLLAPR